MTTCHSDPLIDPYAVMLAAYEELGQRGRPDQTDFEKRLISLWILCRNALLARWADEAGRTCSDLAPLFDVALDEVAKHDLMYAHDLWCSDLVDNVGALVADAAAVIAWYKAAYSGRVTEEFPLTSGEVQTWLDNHDMPPPKGGQLSLFLS